MCKLCQFESCAIYHDDRRDFTMWFDEWVYFWHQDYYENKNPYGVDPLYEPLEAHMNGQEKLVKELSQKGINICNCQFLDNEKGCVIPFDKRPSLCQKEVSICRSIYESLETDRLKLTKRIKQKERDFILFTLEGFSSIEVHIFFPSLHRNKLEMIICADVSSIEVKKEAERIQSHIVNELKKIPSLRLKIILDEFSSKISAFSW